jgi:hypothetical protein
MRHDRIVKFLVGVAKPLTATKEEFGGTLSQGRGLQEIAKLSVTFKGN